MEPEVITVKALEKYKIFASFNDGTEGIYDLSDCAGKGVFKVWDEGDSFSKVFINPENNAIAWNEMLEIDTFNCYLHIRGISFEEYKALNKEKDYAFN